MRPRINTSSSKSISCVESDESTTREPSLLRLGANIENGQIAAARAPPIPCLRSLAGRPGKGYVSVAQFDSLDGAQLVKHPLVPRPVVEAFIACFGGTILREIDALFEDLGFEFDPSAEERAEQQGRGARRSRAAGYLAAADLTQPRDADRLLKAISLALADWERTEGEGEWSDLKRLRRNIDLGGFDWDGSTLVRRIGPVPTPFAIRLEGLEDVNREVGRILESVDRDPADAITAARALVETACKTVLEELGEAIDERYDLPALYKKTALALRVDATQHEVIYRQILQGLTSSIQGLAELRNKLGDAHGPRRGGPRPQPRHARMAAGAAMTVATFLIETLEERRATASVGLTGQ